MRRARDAGAQLSAALLQQALSQGCVMRIESERQTGWASATFAGARHNIALVAERGDALERWLAALPDAEFDLNGHLVADIGVAERSNREEAMIRIEALTLEED